MCFPAGREVSVFCLGRLAGSGVNVLRFALCQAVELRQTPLNHKAPGLSMKPGELGNWGVQREPCSGQCPTLFDFHTGWPWCLPLRLLSRIHTGHLLNLFVFRVHPPPHLTENTMWNFSNKTGRLKEFIIDVMCRTVNTHLLLSLLLLPLLIRYF